MLTPSEMSFFDIQEKLNAADGLVLIEVGGPACAPCVALRPLLQALVLRYEGKVQLYEIDPETDFEATEHWQIRGVPTVLLLRKWVVMGRWIGARAAAVYAKAIDQHI